MPLRCRNISKIVSAKTASLDRGRSTNGIRWLTAEAFGLIGMIYPISSRKLSLPALLGEILWHMTL
jgi:hypothetical protein